MHEWPNEWMNDEISTNSGWFTDWINAVQLFSESTNEYDAIYAPVSARERTVIISVSNFMGIGLLKHKNQQ